MFKLRDASFHNGKPVTSADVKWTLEQVAAPTSSAYLRTQFQGTQSIETPDAHTVRLVMKEPVATLPEWLATFYMPIVAAGTGSADELPVGCGPFVLKSYERGVKLEMTAFDKYYKPGLPKLKAIRLIAYPDENLRAAALDAGDVDLIEYVPWQSMDAIEKNPKLKMQSTFGPFMYLTFNARSGPFKDARVRQAIAYAIKRDDIVKTAFFGRGAALAGMPLPKGTTFYEPSLADTWSYDPDRAKKLLADAGLPNGFTCTLLSTAQYGMHKMTAEVAQQDLAAIGIQAQLNLPDWPTRVALGNRGQYRISVMGTALDSNDPDFAHHASRRHAGAVLRAQLRSDRAWTARASGGRARRIRPGQAQDDLRQGAAARAGSGAGCRTGLALAGLCDGQGRGRVHQSAGRIDVLLRLHAGEHELRLMPA